MTERVRRRALLTILTLAATSYATGHAVRAQEPDVDGKRPGVAVRLAPTDHPPLPGHPSLYWLLPESFGLAAQMLGKDRPPEPPADAALLYRRASGA